MITSKTGLLLGAGVTTISLGGVGAYYLNKDKTIEHRLISSGENLIKEDEEYEIAFKELKGDSTFITDLQKSTNDIRNDSNLEKGRSALKAWCETNLKLDLTKENIENVLPKTKRYCTKPPLTIKEKYEKANQKLISDWDGKFKALKKEITDQTQGKDESLATDLGLTGNNSLEGEGLFNKLEKWCNDNIKTKLNHTSADTIWTKVQKRCLNS